MRHQKRSETMTEFEVLENTASFGLNTRHTARGERHGGAIIVNNGRPIMGLTAV